MSEDRDAELGDAPHPRLGTQLFGHDQAERALLDAYRSGRMPHAFLFGGPPGIGKATLAYRLAKFVLAHPDPADALVARARDLSVDPEQHDARRVSADTHGNLLTLERRADDKGKLRSTIVVDQVRETIPFFGATAEAGRWRVCIVDSVDELKSPEAPNALLKILEEPPDRVLFLLISHAPGRVLPTIRSRCRTLNLRPLASQELAAALAQVSDRAPQDAEVQAAAQAADGSVARALTLLNADALGLDARVADLLQRLPGIDELALHQLADAMGPSDRVALQVFAGRVETWLADCLKTAPDTTPLARLARVSQVWEKVTQSVREAEIYNLERKPMVFSVFGLLRDCA